MDGRRLLIVEDEPIVANLLQESLSKAGFFAEIADSVISARKKVVSFDPDVALLDINLGHGATGVDLAFILNKEHPGIALLILTKHPDLRTAGFAEDDLPPGCGFLRKDLVKDTEYIVKAINDVISNRMKDVRQDQDPSRPLSVLTSTQIEVLRMVAQGFTNSEIAKRRGTSTRAVEQVMKSIFTALNIVSSEHLNPRSEAIRLFISSAGIPER